MQLSHIASDLQDHSHCPIISSYHLSDYEYPRAQAMNKFKPKTPPPSPPPPQKKKKSTHIDMPFNLRSMTVSLSYPATRSNPGASVPIFWSDTHNAGLPGTLRSPVHQQSARVVSSFVAQPSDRVTRNNVSPVTGRMVEWRALSSVSFLRPKWPENDSPRPLDTPNAMTWQVTAIVLLCLSLVVDFAGKGNTERRAAEILDDLVPMTLVTRLERPLKLEMPAHTTRLQRYQRAQAVNTQHKNAMQRSTNRFERSTPGTRSQRHH